MSSAGVALARAVGGHLGACAYVVTSTAPRAVETAVAMGFAVDDTVDMASGYVPGEVEHHDQWTWPRPYLQYAGLLRSGGPLAAIAQAHRAEWTRIVQTVPEGASALVVGHGGAIEPALVACLPAADHASWGAPLSHCDGARLDFDHGRFVAVQFRRAPSLPGRASGHRSVT